MADAPRWRVGTGLDVHPFEDSRPLILAGVRVDYERGLAGHSDGDVAIHAIIDALLGAAGRDDIGTRFPADDHSLAGVDSTRLLRQVVAELTTDGWQIGNVDVTIVAQQPRLSPWRPRMRDALAEALGVGRERVNVKATTTDQLGSIGKGEGIGAQAVALLLAPDTDR